MDAGLWKRKNVETGPYHRCATDLDGWCYGPPGAFDGQSATIKSIASKTGFGHELASGVESKIRAGQRSA
jgi:hypothetical protein